MEYINIAKLAQTLADGTLSAKEFLTRWVQIPYTAFCEDSQRLYLHKILQLLPDRLPSVMNEAAFTDAFLSDERLNRILFDIAWGDEAGLSCLVRDLHWLEDHTLSKSFSHRLISLLQYLIQFRMYDYAKNILNAAPWIGTFEDPLVLNRVCICSYAVTNIPDDEDLISILDTIESGNMDDLFMGKKTLAASAIEIRRFGILEYLFKRNLSSEKYALHDRTVLQFAVEHEDMELFRFALTNLKHDPDCVGLFKETPLVMAVKQNNMQMVQLLLDYGANVSVTDPEGKTLPALCISDEMRQVVLQHNAILRDRDAEVLSQALQAAKNGKLPNGLMKEVLRCKYSEQITDLGMLLAQKGHADQLRLLLQHFDFSLLSDKLIFCCFNTPFSWMKPVSLLSELVDVLLEAGVRTTGNYVTIDNPFPVLADRPEIFDGIPEERVFALLGKVKQLGFDPKATIYGLNLMCFALQGMNVPMLRFLQQEGLRLEDLDDRFGAAAILFAHLPLKKGLGYHKRHREREVWELCAKAGCDINRRNNRGETALHQLVAKPWACESAEVIRIALALGMDPTIKNEAGQTAGDIARQLGLNQEIQDLL